MQAFSSLVRKSHALLFSVLLLLPAVAHSQGVTTAALAGVITGEDAIGLARVNVLAMHVPSGTQYRALTTTLGAYNLPNLRVGGPYRLTVTLLGYEPQTRDSLFLDLGQTLRHDFRMVRRAVQIAGVSITTDRDPTLNAGRTGAGTSIAPELVITVPSIKRSTRDLTRLDPRSDGNFSFAGRNWLFNNISLDGSYFNNPYGLDDPAPGGQANAEPVPYDAVEQVQVSVAPFDVRQG
ncbi:MAG: carboxypeptidase-like regulatory domain-containing protein, partial [Gemmatimonadaceae bacterium]